MDDTWEFETKAVRTRMPANRREHCPPIFMNSSFMFESAEQARALFADEESGDIYSRFTNPNVTELIDRMCALEGADAGIATASGMAAIFATFMALLNADDHMVSARAVFGSTHQIITKYLPRWKVDHTYVDLADYEAWERAIQPNTKLFYIETPSNPGLDVVDIQRLADIAHSREVIFVVDNVFATPYLQQPMAMGADLSLHSTTKFIDGQGRTIGGVVLGKPDIIEKLFLFQRNTGPSMSPMTAWLLARSLETLAVRMARHCENAAALADWLAEHPAIERVIYPFREDHPRHHVARKQMRAGGGLVTFVLRDGLAAGRRLLDQIEMLSHTANLGDTRTIVTHPASTTHSKLSDEERAAVGIEPGLIRVSVGLEHIDDIKKDLDQALSHR